MSVDFESILLLKSRHSRTNQTKKGCEHAEQWTEWWEGWLASFHHSASGEARIQQSVTVESRSQSTTVTSEQKENGSIALGITQGSCAGRELATASSRKAEGGHLYVCGARPVRSIKEVVLQEKDTNKPADSSRWEYRRTERRGALASELRGVSLALSAQGTRSAPSRSCSLCAYVFRLMEMASEDFSMEGSVLVFAAASLTTLGFLATNCTALRGHGELGLQQVLVAIVMISLLIRLSQYALGHVEPDMFTLCASAGMLIWNGLLLL